ncbi:ArsR/SmtB family transcription factor [Thermotalea metallivorans]|uniref:HTH-type transcriptional repressor AseR n=1 Tax=Thermotalea metallivorans TaxID=520762 RepID=A0A140L6H3_9FIRM|nr:metalloregulator ArsR/SmtB family transcription factor [Thermotalea metallivorans]KXG76148.1 HTH-type transcriptional repressor AseR [Thermotalea metallivorans]
MDYASVLKALGESTRIKIIRLLAYRPMYVCELEFVLEMSQPRISQHLKILKHAGLVNDEKAGQKSIYSLNKNFLQKFLSSFVNFLEQPLAEISGFQKEYDRICNLEGNPDITKCKGNCGSFSK